MRYWQAHRKIMINNELMLDDWDDEPAEGGEDLSPEEEDEEPGDVGDEEFEGEV